MENTLAGQQSGSGGLRTAKLFFYAAIILLIAEFIGSFTFQGRAGKSRLAANDLGAVAGRRPGIGE